MRALVEDVEHFRWRVIQDALQEATSAYWERRALDFQRVGTPACDEVAEACRNRAHVALLGGDAREYRALLDEVVA